MRKDIVISIDLAQRLFAHLHDSRKEDGIARDLAQEIWLAAGMKGYTEPEAVPAMVIHNEEVEDGGTSRRKKRKTRRAMSAEGRAAIGAAQKKRWAKARRKKQ